MATTTASLLVQVDLVRRVSKRQRALYSKRMRAVEKAVAAGQPVVHAIEEGTELDAEASIADAVAKPSTEEAIELVEGDLMPPVERGAAAENLSDKNVPEQELVEAGDVIELDEAHEAPVDELPPTAPT